MALPSYYDATTVGTNYDPDLATAYAAGVEAFTLPASADETRVLALLIDIQVDFVMPAPVGRLAVPGAVADTQRTIEWLYHNVGHITHIAASLDTHLPQQIFFPSWWVDSAGNHPAPFTVITLAELQAGKWRPVTEATWSAHYVEQLETRARKQLMIWPYHCLEGTSGRALVPALSEAVMFHSGARMAQPSYLVKGSIAQTEFYSAFEPEVSYTAHPQGGLNTAMLDFLDTFDLIYVAGQARSHCVLESMGSILRYYAARPDVLSKIRYITDGSSSIAGFEAATEQTVNQYADKGIKLVTTADAVE